jgi:hypothetical protein
VREKWQKNKIRVWWADDVSNSTEREFTGMAAGEETRKGNNNNNNEERK